MIIPEFFHPGSRIQDQKDSGSRIKEILIFYPSRIPGVENAPDPVFGSETLQLKILQLHFTVDDMKVRSLRHSVKLAKFESAKFSILK
jgi:hypothetical protein